MSLLARIKELSAASAGEIISNRRHLHANPELPFQQHNTASFVAERLRSFNITPQEGVADTGLVAVIEGNNPGSKTIALRADMDALPITEANDVSYKSTNSGVMHACGHDVHTA